MSLNNKLLIKRHTYYKLVFIWRKMIYRKMIVLGYIIPALLLLLIKLDISTYEPILLILVIINALTVLAVIFSPVLLIMAIYSFKLNTQLKINILFLCLGILHLSIVSVGIYIISCSNGCLMNELVCNYYFIIDILDYKNMI